MPAGPIARCWKDSSRTPTRRPPASRTCRCTRVRTGADASARATVETVGGMAGTTARGRAGATVRGSADVAARDAGHGPRVPEARGARRTVRSSRHVAARDRPPRPCARSRRVDTIDTYPITAARSALAMPDVLPIMTPGSRATDPEPFHRKRGKRCRSGAARAKPFKSNGYLARDRGVWAIEPFTPCGGLRVTPDAAGCRVRHVPPCPAFSESFSAIRRHSGSGGSRNERMLWRTAFRPSPCRRMASQDRVCPAPKHERMSPGCGPYYMVLHSDTNLVPVRRGLWIRSQPPLGPGSRIANSRLPDLGTGGSNHGTGADPDRNLGDRGRFGGPISPARCFGLPARERKNGPERWAKSPNEELRRPYGRRAPSPLDPLLGFRVDPNRGCGPAARDFRRRDRPHRGPRHGGGEARRASASHGFARTPHAH